MSWEDSLNSSRDVFSSVEATINKQWKDELDVDFYDVLKSVKELGVNISVVKSRFVVKGSLHQINAVSQRLNTYDTLHTGDRSVGFGAETAVNRTRVLGAGSIFSDESDGSSADANQVASACDDGLLPEFADVQILRPPNTQDCAPVEDEQKADERLHVSKKLTVGDEDGVMPNESVQCSYETEQTCDDADISESFLRQSEQSRWEVAAGENDSPNTSAKEIFTCKETDEQRPTSKDDSQDKLEECSDKLRIRELLIDSLIWDYIEFMHKDRLNDIQSLGVSLSRVDDNDLTTIIMSATAVHDLCVLDVAYDGLVQLHTSIGQSVSMEYYEMKLDKKISEQLLKDVNQSYKSVLAKSCLVADSFVFIGPPSLARKAMHHFKKAALRGGNRQVTDTERQSANDRTRVSDDFKPIRTQQNRENSDHHTIADTRSSLPSDDSSSRRATKIEAGSISYDVNQVDDSIDTHSNTFGQTAGNIRERKSNVIVTRRSLPKADQDVVAGERNQVPEAHCCFVDAGLYSSFSGYPLDSRSELQNTSDLARFADGQVKCQRWKPGQQVPRQSSFNLQQAPAVMDVHPAQCNEFHRPGSRGRESPSVKAMFGRLPASKQTTRIAKVPNHFRRQERTVEEQIEDLLKRGNAASVDELLVRIVSECVEKKSRSVTTPQDQPVDQDSSHNTFRVPQGNADIEVESSKTYAV